MAVALVISGGGSKGAFAVGVAKYVEEHLAHKRHSIFLGTSTGSLIAPLVAVGALPEVERIYTSVHTSDIITKGNVVSRLLGSTSLFDARPLAKLIDATWTPALFDALMTSPKRVYVTTVCMQTGDVVYWGNHEAGDRSGYVVNKVRDREEWIRAVMASACQPVFMPAIELRSTDAEPRQYVDGGLREYLPVEMAIALQATEIHAVALAPSIELPDNKRYTSAFAFLEKTIDRFSDDVGVHDLRVPLLINSALGRIAEAKRKLREHGVPEEVIDACFAPAPQDVFHGKEVVDIQLIRPEAPLGGGPGGLTFDPTEMKEMVRKGYEAARDHFSAPSPTDPFIV